MYKDSYHVPFCAYLCLKAILKDRCYHLHLRKGDSRGEVTCYRSHS